MLNYNFNKPTKPQSIGSWRQKLMTNEKRVIVEAAAQCYLHEYDSEQASQSETVPSIGGFR